jgi:hypothetical protein
MAVLAAVIYFVALGCKADMQAEMEQSITIRESTFEEWVAQDSLFCTARSVRAYNQLIGEELTNLLERKALNARIVVLGGPTIATMAEDVLIQNEFQNIFAAEMQGIAWEAAIITRMYLRNYPSYVQHFQDLGYDVKSPLHDLSPSVREKLLERTR